MHATAQHIKEANGQPLPILQLQLPFPQWSASVLEWQKPPLSGLPLWTGHQPATSITPPLHMHILNKTTQQQKSNFKVSMHS